MNTEKKFDKILDELTFSANGEWGKTSPNDISGEILSLLSQYVPFSGACITYVKPGDGKHILLNSLGYSTELINYLLDNFISKDPAYNFLCHVNPYPLKWRDFGFDYMNSFSVKEVFKPSGFKDGMTACIFNRKKNRWDVCT